MGQFLILYFHRPEENILKEILSGIQKRTEEYQIWDCVLDNDILYRGDLVINPICRALEKNNEGIHLTAGVITIRGKGYKFNPVFKNEAIE